MLLQCGVDGSADEEPRPQGSWLGAATLDSLAELNELGFTLLAEQAALPAAQPGALLQEFGATWRALDAPARRRAAACPYLLLDVGFGARERWREPAQVGDPARGGGSAFFTVPGTIEALRLALTLGWHLARTQRAAARLLLGMPPECAALIAALTLRQVHALAERHPQWLRPRWPARPELWRDLLKTAASGEARALERSRLYGLSLLAAEARAAAVTFPHAPAPPPRSAPVACVISPAGTASTAPSPRSPARP